MGCINVPTSNDSAQILWSIRANAGAAEISCKLNEVSGIIKSLEALEKLAGKLGDQDLAKRARNEQNSAESHKKEIKSLLDQAMREKINKALDNALLHETAEANTTDYSQKYLENRDQTLAPIAENNYSQEMDTYFNDTYVQIKSLVMNVTNDIISDNRGAILYRGGPKQQGTFVHEIMSMAAKEYLGNRLGFSFGDNIDFDFELAKGGRSGGIDLKMNLCTWQADLKTEEPGKDPNKLGQYKKQITDYHKEASYYHTGLWRYEPAWRKISA